MRAIRRADRLGPRARAGAAAAFLAVAAGVAVLLKRVRPPGGAEARAEIEAGAPAPATQERRCECGQEFRMSGAGRHRVLWPAGADERDAILDDRCPACERPLASEEEHAAAA